ncbi:MAG TPA: hypothetical protein VNP73_10695 [Actinomycetota bacterium]|nr:hypothetical protein [Actinomycetota bacterium]
MTINLFPSLKVEEQDADRGTEGKGGTTSQLRSSAGTRFASLAALLCVALLVLSPTPAYAQIDVGDTVDDATDAVEDTVEDATETVEDTVDDATETVDEATDTVDRATDEEGPVQEAVDTVTGTVDDATGGRTKPVTDVLRDTTGGALKTVDKTVEDIVDGVMASQGPQFAPGSTRGSVRGQRVTANDRVKAGRSFGDTGTDDIADPATGTSADPIENTSVVTPRSPEAGGTLGQIERIVRALAFPMILLVLIAGFLVIQGRLDRNDPKLTLAPLDVDEEYLSFR